MGIQILTPVCQLNLQNKNQLRCAILNSDCILQRSYRFSEPSVSRWQSILCKTEVHPNWYLLRQRKLVTNTNLSRETFTIKYRHTALNINVNPLLFHTTVTLPWPLLVFQELLTSCQDHSLHNRDPGDKKIYLCHW